MTDKQLALLLLQIVWGLRQESRAIEDAIRAKTHRHPNETVSLRFFIDSLETQAFKLQGGEE